MKINILQFAPIIIAISCLIGCSKDSDIEFDDNGSAPVTNVNVTVCTDWDASVSKVESCMSKYKAMNTDDVNILVFVDARNTHMVSYEFVDNHLRASLLSFKSANPIETKEIFNPKEYKYIGNADGAPVYTKESQNTMCTVLERLDGESVSHTLYGFTPIESTRYDSFEPITVTLSDPESVSTMSAKINGSYAGVEKISAAYVVISLSATFETVSRVKATISGNSFSANISVNEPNATVYYYAEIQCDGVWYQSAVSSVEMMKVKLYAIGDPYPDSKNPIGVVCAIKNSGMNGTIVSLDQDRLKWDTNGIFCTDYSAYNSSDGSKNKIGTTQPFAKWIAGHGSGWFGPARYQLEFSLDALRTINAGLNSVGGTQLDGFYWSSTQKDGNNAYVVTVTETNYMGYSNKYSFYHNKDNSNSARAMKYF